MAIPTLKQLQDAQMYIEAALNGNVGAAPVTNPLAVVLSALGYFEGPLDQATLSGSHATWYWPTGELTQGLYRLAQDSGFSLPAPDPTYGYHWAQMAPVLDAALQQAMSNVNSGVIVNNQSDADAVFESYLLKYGLENASSNRIIADSPFTPIPIASNGVTAGFKNGMWGSVLQGASNQYWGSISPDGTLHSWASSESASSPSAGPVHSLTTPTAGSSSSGSSSGTGITGQQHLMTPTGGSGSTPPTPPKPAPGVSTAAKVGIGAGVIAAALAFLKLK